MKNIGKFYINGSWVPPNSTEIHELLNPATEEKSFDLPMADVCDVNAAVAAAKGAF